MVEFSDMKTVEVAIVNKRGVRTIMPSLGVAQSYAKSVWNGEVVRIEIKSVITVDNG